MDRWTALAATTCSCFALFACAMPTQSPPAGLVIADVTIISPERSLPVEHAYVRILDGRIAEVSEHPSHRG